MDIVDHYQQRRLSQLPRVTMQYISYGDMRNAAGHAREKNDCAVIAYSLVADVSYNTAHEALAALGRKVRRGCHFAPMANALDLYQRADLASKRLYKVMQSMQSGRYVLRVRGHACAVIDGQVYDCSEPRPTALVQMIYQYSASGALDARGNTLEQQGERHGA